MTKNIPATHRATVRRTFAYPRERVFAAWAQPEQFGKWMGPDDLTTESYTADLRTGGSFCLRMRKPDNELYEATGTYREVRAPELLTYTWKWTEDEPENEVQSLITVTFEEVPGGTELVLTHDLLASEESAARHVVGWGETMDKLAAFLDA